MHAAALRCRRRAVLWSIGGRNEVESGSRLGRLCIRRGGGPGSLRGRCWADLGLCLVGVISRKSLENNPTRKGGWSRDDAFWSPVFTFDLQGGHVAQGASESSPSRRVVQGARSLDKIRAMKGCRTGRAMSARTGAINGRFAARELFMVGIVKRIGAPCTPLRETSIHGSDSDEHQCTLHNATRHGHAWLGF